MVEMLWQPSAERIAKANMTAFRQAVEKQWVVDLPDFAALHAFSIGEIEKFWMIWKQQVKTHLLAILNRD